MSIIPDLQDHNESQCCELVDWLNLFYAKVLCNQLTASVFQQLYVSNGVSGVHVEAVAVNQVSQDVFGVEGRGGEVDQLGETQRSYGMHLKPPALEEKEKKTGGHFSFWSSVLC